MSLFRSLQLDREERLLLLLMGALVALLFGSYTVAKVLRDSLFISAFGARALPFGYIAVATASVAFVWLEPRLARRMSHLGVSTVAQLFAIAMSIVAAIVYPVEKRWLAAAFYVWTGSQAMMLLPRFWVLALDVWDSGRARTIFPFLSGCGLVGGVAAGAFTSLATTEIGIGGLLWSLAGLLVAVLALSVFLPSRRPARSEAVPSGGESRLEIVFRSPLLRYLVAAVILSVLVATMVDFQFKYLAEKAYPSRGSLTRFLGAFHAGLNGFAMLVQFGAAGWILRHAGLGPSAALQTMSVLAFSLLSLAAPAWGVVLALRWVQGVTFQTLGKSVAEIYYMAVRPPERRRVKPAIDVIAERSADAVVGLLLVVLLHAIGVELKFLAGLTALLAAAWIGVQWRLHRKYMDAFGDSLARRWIEPEMAADSLRTKAARRVIREMLESGEEREVAVALDFCGVARDLGASPAIRACLGHPSVAVRAAAVRTMTALAIDDRDGTIRSFLREQDQRLKAASVEYLFERGADPSSLADELLEGDDPALRDYALESLASRPEVAVRTLTLDRIDRWLETGSPRDLATAGRALGLLRGPAAVARVRALLARNDLEAKRAALLAAAANGGAFELADAILPLVSVAELRPEMLEATSAMGDRAVPSLERRIEEKPGEGARAAAAHALSRIASQAAVAALVRLARSENPTTRHLGIRNLNRVRRARDHPVVPRPLVHRMFLRELLDYRTSLDRTLALAGCKEDELRLLAESYRESADRALERACRALGCWYEAPPIEGVYRGLRSREREGTAKAFEYLAAILPRTVFRTVRRLFQEAAFQKGDRGRARASRSGQDPIVHCIERAWKGGDAWLRACAVRAARVVPGVDLGSFQSAGADEDPMVRAELESLAAGNRAPSEKGRRRIRC